MEIAPNLNENISKMFSQLENFITTKTVVGEPIVAGDITLVPLIDVSFGMGSGSSEGKKEEKSKKGDKALGGVGAKMEPSAMLVVRKNGTVELINIKPQDYSSWQAKLIDLIPQFTQKFDFSDIFNKNKESEDLNKKEDNNNE